MPPKRKAPAAKKPVRARKSARVACAAALSAGDEAVEEEGAAANADDQKSPPPNIPNDLERVLNDVEARDEENLLGNNDEKGAIPIPAMLTFNAVRLDELVTWACTLFKPVYEDEFTLARDEDGNLI
ncbi:hypothetical protein F5Y03DRAFT_400937 [Xylaria venustula]|nr:hypothetical protein F5Y03DRAFT_400937 [Xylaria venustula]